jgi:hypothetical protein
MIEVRCDVGYVRSVVMGNDVEQPSGGTSENCDAQRSTMKDQITRYQVPEKYNSTGVTYARRCQREPPSSEQAAHLETA